MCTHDECVHVAHSTYPHIHVILWHDTVLLSHLICASISRYVHASTYIHIYGFVYIHVHVCIYMYAHTAFHSSTYICVLNYQQMG